MRTYILNCNFNYSMRDVLGLVQRYRMTGHIWYVDELYDEAHDGANIGEWSAPSWARRGDLCLFMCAKSAQSNIRKFRRDVEQQAVLDVSQGWFDRAYDVSQSLAGQVFGYAYVASAEPIRWASRQYYVNLERYRKLEHPVDVLVMEPLVRINRFGGITEVSGDGQKLLLAECGIDTCL